MIDCVKSIELLSMMLDCIFDRLKFVLVAVLF